MGLLNFLFGNKSQKLSDFTDRGAIVLDVRSKAEFDTGAISGSKHIPLQEVAAKIQEIKKWDKPVIACCASGMRSASAVDILKSNGIEAMNGRGWASLSKKL